MSDFVMLCYAYKRYTENDRLNQSNSDPISKTCFNQSWTLNHACKNELLPNPNAVRSSICYLNVHNTISIKGDITLIIGPNTRRRLFLQLLPTA